MPNTSQFEPVVAYNQTAVIANSASESGVVDLSGATLCGLIMPAAFDGTTLTFSSSTSATGTFQNLYDANGNQISATIAASRNIALNPADFAGVRYLKIISNSAESAERTITISARAL